MGPEHILDFWFAEQGNLISPESARRWFMGNHEFELEVARRFGATHAAVVRGDCEGWCGTARGRLAYVIVLDQLSRSLHRGRPEMFANDPQALRAAVEGIARGHDRELSPGERVALYMPLLHAEDLEVQDRCHGLFEDLRREQPAEEREAFEEVATYAETHREIIRRFGRFPHRNAILGRPSTPEELDFMNEPETAF